MDTTEQGAIGFVIIPRYTFRSVRDELIFDFLVKRANYKDTPDCKRGQLFTSALKIAKETGFSEDKIRTTFEHLVADGLIEIETFKDRKKGIKLTIKGYDEMQNLQNYRPKNPELNPEYDPELTPDKNVDVPTVEGGTNQDHPELNPEFNPNSLTSIKHNKTNKDKRLKDSSPKRKKEKRVYDESSDAYILAKYLRNRILRWKPNALVPKETPEGLASWSNDMRLMMEIDRRDKHDIAKVIHFATDDPFWQMNVLSANKLRKQYDRLEAEMNRKVLPINRQVKGGNSYAADWTDPNIPSREEQHKKRRSF